MSMGSERKKNMSVNWMDAWMVFSRCTFTRLTLIFSVRSLGDSASDAFSTLRMEFLVVCAWMPRPST